MTTRLRDVQYHVLVYSPDGSGGPGAPKLELTPDVLNVVWQAGLNLPEMCAFTIARENAKLDQMAWLSDHVKVFREDALGVTPLFAGKLVKPTYGEADAVVMAWDYKAFLQLSRTGYNVLYPSKNLGTQVVSPEWVIAKGAANSPLGFVTTGTIEDPLALDGVTPIKTNDQFGVNLFNRLYTFFQIAEMAMANTSNTVAFEITRTLPHTFNFWKNKGSASGLVLLYPGNVSSHDYSPSYDLIRNDRATVIVDPATGTDSAYTVTDAGSIAAYGALQDAVTVKTLLGLTSTLTETDQLKQAMARLLKEGIRLPKTVTVWPRQGLVSPYANINLADTFRARLRNEGSGAVLDANLRLVAMSGAWRASYGEVIQMQGRGVD